MAKRKRNGAPRGATGRAPRMMKRFELPAYCDCRSVVMRELEGLDELEASVWAEKNASSATAQSQIAQFQADQRESIRLSLVQVDDQRVNVDGVPFKELDNWSMRTMRFLREFYADLNGVELDELKNALKGAEVLTPDLVYAPDQNEPNEEEADHPTDG